MTDQRTYFARLIRIPFAENGLRSFALGGQLFTPEAGWLPVTADQAQLLGALRSDEGDLTSPLAFQVLAPGAPIPADPPPPPQFAFPTYPGDLSPPGPASSSYGSPTGQPTPPPAAPQPTSGGGAPAPACVRSADDGAHPRWAEPWPRHA